MIYLPLQEDFDNQSELNFLTELMHDVNSNDSIGHFDKIEFAISGLSYFEIVTRGKRQS